jgi:putative transposase
LTLLEKPADYDAFLRVVDETWEHVPLPILAMVVMPNHWHFVVKPAADDQVSNFFRRLALTHTMRWHAHYRTSGTGHVYQGRFKCFPIQSDKHLLTVMRYVERNALRANFCQRAEDWRWGTAFLRQTNPLPPWLLIPTDPALPHQWPSLVNKPQTQAELDAIRNCIRRGSPFGDERWIKSSVVRLGLETTRRPRGRPRKESSRLQ